MRRLPSTCCLRAALLVAAVLAAAGCAVPGAGRIQGPPDGLPPSLALVTGDAVAFTLYDTDPRSRAWRRLGAVAGRGTDNRALTALHAPLFAGETVRLEAVSSWVGPTAGTMLYQLDVDGSTDAATTMYFADVRDEAALARFLRRGGWSRRGAATAEGLGSDLRLWRLPPGHDATFTAIAASDEALVAARTTKALRTFLRAADEYATPRRRATSEFAVEARRRVPAAVVVRSDLLRTQLRRTVQQDPALLELSRWATSGPTLFALRDGWVGIDGAGADDAGTVRVVGAANWIPDLAPELELAPVDADVLEELPEQVDDAVALRDPGQHAAGVLDWITASSYATEQDVPDGSTRIELFPLLARLDGEAAIGLDRDARVLHVHVRSGEPTDLARDVQQAIRLAGLGGSAVARARGVSAEIELDGDGGLESGKPPAGDVAAAPVGLAAAGRPPRPPIAWLRLAPGRCSGAGAGWLTWDEVDRFQWALRLRLDDDGTSCAGRASPLRLLGFR